MLVTVIITTFKRPTLLQRALRSVLAQRHDGFEIEIIVSDDDLEASARSCFDQISPDQPDTISLKYISRTSSPGGVAASRNRAFAQSRGEWILFLDDDDELTALAIERLLVRAISSGADFCAGNYSITSEDKNQIPLTRDTISHSWNDADDLYLRNKFPVGSFIIRRACITSLFYQYLTTHEDWLFLIENLSAVDPRPKITLVEAEVLRVYHATDGSRNHRNEAGGQIQTLLDYARIYSLHPVPALVEMRMGILKGMEPGFHIDLEMLFGKRQAPSGPFPVSTKQGTFLICNPNETIQFELLHRQEFEILAPIFACAIAEVEPGAIVDVGANIGSFSVPVALRYPSRQVISIEPQAAVFMQLCSNLTLNRIASASPKNVAIGLTNEKKRTIRVPRFNIFEERYAGSVTLDNAVAEIRREIPGVAEPSQWAHEFDDIPLVSLDSIVGDAKVCFIKIDVEGMELEVLKSGENCLKHQKPCLFFEAWSLELFRKQREELLRYVTELGYQLLEIENDFFAFHPDRISQASIFEILGSATKKYHNFIEADP